ncbi:hypothetical protein Plhal710r2_c056g0163551 [Plasmopara halstedii]
MKPLRLRGFFVAAFFLAATETTHALDLSTTVVYTSSSFCTGSTSGTPVLVTAVPDLSSSCSPSIACTETPASSSLFPATVCSTTDGTATGTFIQTKLPSLFGSNPYVAIETYTASSACATATDITDIKVYLADGKCHKTDTAASYRATRKADGSATVQSYSDASCTTTSGSLFSVTAGQSANSCATGSSGIADQKVYGSGTTPLYLTTTSNYDSADQNCVSGVPSLVSIAVANVDTCTATSTCTGSSAPYTGTKCNSVSSYRTDMTSAFGVNPYVIVETYNAGKSCAADELASVLVYLADGKCHKTSGSSSYRATRKTDGSATVQPYSDGTCSTAGTLFTVTATQATSNTCASGANGILDTKVYGDNATPLYYTSTLSYDTSTLSCVSGVPLLVTTTAAYVDTSCTTTSSCTGSSAPYTGTKCSSESTYRSDITAAFGSSPFVIVEQYSSGQSCVQSALTSITSYLADGKCYKLSGSTSYRAARKADSSAFIQTYSDLTCTNLGSSISISAAAGASNTCDSDRKAYGGNTTPFFLTSTMNYDTLANSCSSGAPSFVSIAVGNFDNCAATSSCSGSSAPYTGTKCSSVSSYKNDLATAFGVNSYVIVEKYSAGQSCAAGYLSEILVYLADGKCHKISGSSSYRATRKTDGSATVQPYSDGTCSTVGTLFTVTATQATSNSCAANANGILDTKVYGGNATPLYYTSTLSYDSNTLSCASGVPLLVTTTAADVDTSCTTTSSCTGSSAPYTGTKCSSESTYRSDITAAFGSSPFVIVEQYSSGQSCVQSALTSITSYLADGKCNKLSGSASYRAARKADSSAFIQTYSDLTCTTLGSSISISASAGASNTCDFDRIAFGGNTSPFYLTSTMNYDSLANSCSSGTPSFVSIAVGNFDNCAVTSSCSGSAAPYTGTKCSSVSSYKTDLVTAFGVNPYVIVEKYTAGQFCGAGYLSSIMVYLADGKCHKISGSSYRATRKLDGTATVQSYSDGTCSVSSTLFSVSAAESANSCASNSNGIVDTKVFGENATPLYLTSTLNYDSSTLSCVSGVPSFVETAVSIVDTTCTTTSSCTGSSAPFTGTKCSLVSTYQSDMAAAFGSTPYVTIEQYNNGQVCASKELSGIKTYLADGKCHKSSGAASYRASRKLDNSAIVQKFTDVACTVAGTTITVTASAGTQHTCVSDTKAYGVGSTPLYLTSTMNYDTSANTCNSGVPSQVSTAISAFDTCTPTSSCSGSSAPYTGTKCNSVSSYQADMAAAFGVNAYLIVEKYTAGQACAADQLASITTYLADGKCHKTSPTTSYRATRNLNGAATIQPYLDGTCTNAGSLMTVTVAQLTNSCASDSNGFVDTKVYGFGMTPLYFSSTMNYDSTGNSCKSPAIPSFVSSAVVAVDTCTVSTTCTGQAAPYTGTTCSSSMTYKADMDATFGVNPYIIVEKYTAGQSCAADKLASISTYLADGKCHKTSSATSYRATRKVDGSATIQPYLDSTCTSADTLVTITVAQLTNSCAADVNGIANTKVYGFGATPLYLTSTMNYDTKDDACKSPGVPSFVKSAIVAVDVCSASTACTGQSAPYTGTTCSSKLTFKSDMDAAFGVNPYVIVEKYDAGQACAADKLSEISTYLADGKCHKMGLTTSYRATRNLDGSATIQPFTDATCTAAGTLMTISVAQLSNSCSAGANGFADLKVFGSGVTPLYLTSTMSYDSNEKSCTSGVPFLVSSAIVAVDICSPTTACTGQASPYTGKKCSSTLTFKADMDAAFGKYPYVVVEQYTSGQACAADKLTGITTYLADNKCYKTSSATSYRATQKVDGTATVQQYLDASCGSAGTLLTISNAQKNTCATGGSSDLKVYGGGLTPLYISSTVIYETNSKSCKSGLPSLVKSAIVAVDSCTASTACLGQAVPYTGTSCSSTLTYKDDMDLAFGKNPYVIVEKYVAGQSCAVDKLSGLTTYLADAKCHKSDTGKSYRASFSKDGTASIQEFTDTQCNTAGPLLSVTASQTANSCTTGSTGIADTKVFYGGSATPLYLSLTMKYDTDSDSCKSGVPSSATAAVVAVDTCVATTSCTGQSAPYTGTSCSSMLTIKDDMDAAFGNYPYVYLEKYTVGQTCAADKLTSILVYLADGKCHKTDSTTSYRATRNADGSAIIQSFTDASCGATGTTLTVTTAQLANSCAADSNGFADMKVRGAGTTPLYLTSSVNYETNGDSCKSGLPSLVTSTIVGVDACSPTTVCTGQDPFVGTSCSSTLTHKPNMAIAFGLNPYVIVEKYVPGQTCSPDKLSSITTYLADGKCHKIDTTSSYRATRKEDGSASVQEYTGPSCTTAGNLLSVSVAQLANSCAADANGFADKKVYGFGVTPLYLTSTMNYETNVNSCKSGLPSLINIAVGAIDVCVPTTSCSNSAAPFTGKACSTSLTYKDDVANAFGPNPNVIIEKYNAGKACAAGELSSIVAYLADGKCHKLDASTSYRATRKADGSASVQEYTDASCSTAGALTTITAAQTANSCAANANGIVDKKVFGGGVTPLYFTSTVNYESSANSCKSGLPSLVNTAIGTLDVCVPSTTCLTQAAPFTGKSCSSSLSFRDDMAATFGSNPYVIVETYNSGKSCALGELSGILTYLADGKCHKTDSTTSYRATRKADGSVTIQDYTDVSCGIAGALLTVTSAQTANSCASNVNGIPDKKVFGVGTTPLYFTSTVSYEASTNACSSGTPSYVATAVSLTDVCTATTACTGQAAPFKGTSCSTVSSFKKDIDTSFGSNPYLTVKKYNGGKKCAAAELASIATYLADGKCHVSGSSASYAATRSADGSAVVQLYTDLLCGVAGTRLTVSATQTANSCAPDINGIVDTKVYGSGITDTVYSSKLLFDANTNNCVSGIPSQVVTVKGGASTCLTSTTCSGQAAPYLASSCGSTLTYQDDMADVFGAYPYVIVEKYAAGQLCATDKLTGIKTYLADGMCHKTDSTSSYRANRKADGSASVQEFTGAACGTAGATLTVTAAQTANSCTAGNTGIVDTKVYGGGSTPLYLSSVSNYDVNTKSCKSGLPSLVKSTVVAVDTCTASTSCTGQAAPYAGTSCSSTLTYKDTVASAFGTNPYVILEKYTSGQSCAADALVSITTYLADGKCHKTDSTTSYRASRKSDNSAIIQAYTDATCGTAGSLVTISKVDGTSHTCSSDTKAYGAGSTPFFLTSTVKYETDSNACVSGLPSLVSTAVANVDTGCTATTACTGSAAPYTGTSCSSVASYPKDMAKAFGTSPYVTVEKYSAGKQCDVTELESITTYLADGKCHVAGSSASYAATRSTDGSAFIQQYTDVTCGALGASLTVTSSQTANSCAANGNGIVDMKVYGFGKTAVVYSSSFMFDSKAGDCPSGVPSFVSTVKGDSTACSPSTTCSGSAAPFSATKCSSTLSYKKDMGAAFGVNPHIIVEKYTAGQACAADKLTSIKTYLADGKCHKIDASASYRATRKADNSATIQSYTDGACGTSGTLLTITAAQSTSCAADNNGIVDTKVYGAGSTPLYLTSVVNYETSTNLCKSGLPSLVKSSVVNVDTCTATAACTGVAVPYSGTSCSSTLSYKDDMAAAFGSNPYVIVEKYVSGQICSADKLTDITTYSADGKCHKIDSSTSYRATRKSDNSATVQSYTDNVCGAAGTLLTVTAAQTANSCASGANGIPDTKVYGGGSTPLYLTSTMTYDTKANLCKSGLPALVSSAVVAVDSCSASAVCTGQGAPYTGTSCSSTLTYKDDMLAAFGPNPFVVVEKYNSGQSCAAAELSSLTAYIADGKCHKTEPTKSYIATRTTDGAVTIQSYVDANCGAEGAKVRVTPNTAGTCYSDSKVYGIGVTGMTWSTIAISDSKTCGAPTQMTLTSQFSCKDAGCFAFGDRSISYTCASDYIVAAKKTFGTSTPFIVVEIYEDGGNCNVMEGVMAFAADTKCHLTIDGSSSFTVSLSTDGSGTMLTYDDKECKDGTPFTAPLTKEQLSSHQCIRSTKYYAFNAPTPPVVAPTTQPPVVPTSPPTEAPTPPPPTTSPTGSGSANTGSTSDGAKLSPISALFATALSMLGWFATFLL